MKQSARALALLAHEQGGYFTAKQARNLGYTDPLLVYHVSSGNVVRVERGLYRLPSVPASQDDDWIRLSLWSRNREDEPQAVVSHQSALVLHDLGEVLPGDFHLTVPPRFRKSVPPGVVLHKGILSDRDIEERAGFRVTTPLRTLLDVAEGGVSREQLAKAVAEALARGMVREGARGFFGKLGAVEDRPRPEAEVAAKGSDGQPLHLRDRVQIRR